MMNTVEILNVPIQLPTETQTFMDGVREVHAELVRSMSVPGSLLGVPSGTTRPRTSTRSQTGSG